MLSWLQEDPDAKAIALLNRLKSAHPDRFSDTHLRTLQRRVQQWRGIMAKKLVYAAVDEPVPELPAMPELALVGTGPQVLVPFPVEYALYRISASPVVIPAQSGIQS